MPAPLIRPGGEHWRAFDAAWFRRWQWLLLAILDEPILGRLFRWVLRIRRTDVGYRHRIVKIEPHAYHVQRPAAPRRRRVLFAGFRPRIVEEPAVEHVADIRTHPKYAKRVYFAFAVIWWLLHAWDWAIADRLVPALSAGFATLTAYPDPGSGSTTVDGYVQRAAGSEAWSTIRDGAGTGAVVNSGGADVWVGLVAHATTNTYSSLRRAIFTFDTSGVSGVVSGSCSIYSVYAYDYLSAGNLGLYDASPAADNTLAAGDYSNVGTTAQSDDTFTAATWNSTAYRAFTLNAAGLSGGNWGGVARLGLRFTKDATNTTPGWSGGASSGWGFYFADRTGSSKDPKLELVYGLPTVTTTTLADGSIALAYSQTLAATGGTPPYTWSVTVGSLPTGLSLNPSTGEISGTPSSAGTSNFTVQVEDDDSETNTKALSITVYAAPSITTTTLPNGATGSAYSQTLATSGGKAALSFAVTSGSLPDGLSLNTSTGGITGTPTVADTFNFTVTVTDALGVTDAQALAITITTESKIYLAATAPTFLPATIRGAWNDTSAAVTKALAFSKASGGAITSIGHAETDSNTEFDVLLFRGVSPPLAAQTIQGTLDVILGVLESNSAADFYWHVHAFVTVGATDAVRGTLLDNYVENTSNEWPTTAAGLGFQSAQALSTLAIQAGDRLVVEIGFIARNSSTTSRTGTLHYGTQDPTTLAEVDDLEASSAAVTTTAGHLIFSHGLVELSLSATDLTGTLTQGVELELSGDGNGWTDVAGEGDVSDREAVAQYGFDGDEIEQRVAPPGDWTFGLDTSEQCSQGLGAYTLTHPNRRAGFDYHIAARWRFTYFGTPYYVFRGRIADIDTDLDEQLTRCKVLDWMDEAMRTPRPAIAAQITQRCDQVVTAMLDELDVPPPGTEIAESASTLTAALDRGDRMLTVREELQRLAMSEFCWAYVKGDIYQGGTFAFEARGGRASTADIAVSFNDDMARRGLVMTSSRDQVYKAVQATVYPVRQDAAVTLYALESPIPLKAGQTITFTVAYRHPDTGDACGGTSVDPDNDVAFWQNDDATGSDLIANLSVTAVDVGWGARYTLENTGGTDGYVTTLVATGTALLRDVVTVSEEIAGSYGGQVLDLKLPYQSSLATASKLVMQLASLLGTPVARVKSITFCASVADVYMVAALSVEIGKVVQITSTRAGLVDARFEVQHIRRELRQGGVLWCTWGLIPAGLNPYWPNSPTVFEATGGSISHAGGYTYHTFASDDDFTIESGQATVEYLIVGGGGAGGDGSGSGGGGGGRVVQGSIELGTGIYAVTVGVGGAVVTSDRGETGGDSAVVGIGAAKGGGGGGRGSGSVNGLPGGPGGGGAAEGVGGTPEAGTGYAGGAGTSGISAPNRAGGGGGGAGGVGSPGTSGRGGDGGPGVVSSITGGPVYYGGGGGGNGLTGGAGGIGGGGDNEEAGTDGLGGGGGRSAAGGDGTVIIRYPTPA